MTAAPPPVVTAADEALQQAVIAYKSNNFAASQGYLETARASGSTSANVDRLQSNLDVLLGKDDDAESGDTNGIANGDEKGGESFAAGVEDGASRRVRELANAKTVTMQVDQEKAADKARWAYQSGDVEEAERYLEEVIALADDIGMTEQKESAEQSGKKEEAKKLLSEVVEMKKRKSAMPSASTTSATIVTIPSTPASGESSVVVEAEPLESPDAPEAPEVLPAEEPVPVAPASIDEDVLMRIPTGRTYESVVQSLPGVVTTRGDRTEGRVGRKDAKPVQPAKPSPQRVTKDAAPEDEAPDEQDVTEQDAPVQAPPADTRAALDVKAGPLTLAMPLGGEVVRQTAALLPANAHPTLTVPYRTLSRHIAVRKTAPGAAR